MEEDQVTKSDDAVINESKTNTTEASTKISGSDTSQAAINTIITESSESVSSSSLDDADENNAKISDHEYELINDKYYYTDESGKKFVFDSNLQDWVEANSHEEKENEEDKNSDVTTDEEGRTYYHSDGMYLCQDPQGQVFYMDSNNEWKPWDTLHQEKPSTDNRWYFYQGNDTFYRDNDTNTVYKLNKENNDWIVYEGKIRKRPRINKDEEFDSDEDSDIDDEPGSVCQTTAPPGATTDPNISYDGSSYTKIDPTDNTTYEWDINRRAWFPKFDDNFMATYQLSYGFNPDGTKNENPLKFDDDDEEDFDENTKKKTEEKIEPKKKPGWFEMDNSSNTKVYVSNLPLDMDEEHFVEFMQKCGLVTKRTDRDAYKVKMYQDKEGKFKGDALCTYMKVESVELALQILDGYLIEKNTIKVERAKFEQKGKYDPSLKPRKRPKKQLEKMQKRQQKLFDWRPEPMRGERGKFDNVIIIRNVFDPKQFDENAELILTHTEAMRNQCSNFGEIKKMELFDRHPEGVIKVTFKEIEYADLCLSSIHDRLYCDRRLTAATWDGKEKFKVEETEEERVERIQKWSQFLEGGGDSKDKENFENLNNKQSSSKDTNIKTSLCPETNK